MIDLYWLQVCEHRSQEIGIDPLIIAVSAEWQSRLSIGLGLDISQNAGRRSAATSATSSLAGTLTQASCIYAYELDEVLVGRDNLASQSVPLVATPAAMQSNELQSLAWGAWFVPSGATVLIALWSLPTCWWWSQSASNQIDGAAGAKDHSIGSCFLTHDGFGQSCPQTACDESR